LKSLSPIKAGTEAGRNVSRSLCRGLRGEEEMDSDCLEMNLLDTKPTTAGYGPFLERERKDMMMKFLRRSRIGNTEQK